MRGNPFGYAERLEKIKPSLSDQEWTKGSSLWDEYLARSADLRLETDYSQFCGFRDEAQSLGMDAAFIVYLPFKGDDSGERLAAAPLSMAAGMIGLGSDIVTFIPGAAATAERKLRESIHVRHSTRAFRKFADFVEASEKNVGAVAK